MSRARAREMRMLPFLAHKEDRSEDTKEKRRVNAPVFLELLNLGPKNMGFLAPRSEDKIFKYSRDLKSFCSALQFQFFDYGFFHDFR